MSFDVITFDTIVSTLDIEWCYGSYLESCNSPGYRMKSNIDQPNTRTICDDRTSDMITFS